MYTTATLALRPLRLRERLALSKRRLLELGADGGRSVICLACGDAVRLDDDAFTYRGDAFHGACALGGRS